MPAVRNLRRIAAALATVWAVYFLYHWRSADYGFAPVMLSVIVGLHLPLLLLLWPRLAWRWNPLISTEAAALAVLLVMGLELAARNTSITDDMNTVEAAPTPAVRTALLLPVGFGGLIVLTFILPQQRRQRRIALACTLGLIAPIEAVHQIEEALFRAEAAHATEWIQDRAANRSALPTSEEFDQDYEPLWLSGVHYYSTGGKNADDSPGFCVSWARATTREHGLIYTSDGKITGHD